MERVFYQALANGAIDFQNVHFTTDEAFAALSAKDLPSAGDILITKDGSIGRAAVVPVGAPTFCINQSVAVLWLRDIPADRHFLVNAIHSELLQQLIWDAAEGAAIKHISITDFVQFPLPIPPLAEQHRIVAKVDELMALCDRLEQEVGAGETAHAKLVETLLGTLTQSTDADDIATNWQRLAEHFDTLFTTEASIDTLKQTVLQLAVMGKLVPQDSEDEPASELLKRIAKERSRLEAEGKVKKSKPLPPVGDGEPPFEVADGWVWARFAQIAMVNGRLVDSQDHPDAMQVAPDSIEKGTGRLIERRTVRDAGVRGPNQRFQAGQLLYSKIRPSLSKAVIVDFEGLCSADMYPLDPYIEPRFLLNQILSEIFLEQVRVAENRVKMPKLNQESLNAFLVCVPPLAEQHRIVTKVDELMSLCDRLKAALAESRTRQARLSATLIESTLQAV